MSRLKDYISEISQNFYYNEFGNNDSGKNDNTFSRKYESSSPINIPIKSNKYNYKDQFYYKDQPRYGDKSDMNSNKCEYAFDNFSSINPNKFSIGSWFNDSEVPSSRPGFHSIISSSFRRFENINDGYDDPNGSPQDILGLITSDV